MFHAPQIMEEIRVLCATDFEEIRVPQISDQFVQLSAPQINEEIRVSRSMVHVASRATHYGENRFAIATDDGGNLCSPRNVLCTKSRRCLF